MLNLSIEIEKSEAAAYETAADQEAIGADFVDIKRFDGGVAIVAVVLPLLSATLPFVTKMIVEQIRSKKHVVIKVDGVEVRGVDAHNAGKLLSQILTEKQG